MGVFAELRRRNVFRVVAAYVVAAWLLIQVAETIFPLFGFDETPARIVVIALAIGFVPALVLAWVFEWTPEGLKREGELEPGYTASLGTARKFDRWIMAGLAVALAYFAFDKFVLEPQHQAAERQTQAEQLAAATEEAREEGRTEALLESYGDQSIAVLPFVNMSSDREQEFFSDGIAEEILNVLARIPELRVISRSSSFAYKGQALEVPEIAELLKVAHVLEGSVRRSGDTVRITAQLIEAHSDTHLWSKTWDREFRDVLAIQDEIARQVAEYLELTLLGASTETPVVDPRAHELVLRARHLLYRFDREDASRAESILREAIEIAPDYAPAHAGLAEAYRQGANQDLRSRPQNMVLFDSALDMALSLDPEDSQALGLRGWNLAFRSSQPEVEAARHLWRKAIESNPSNNDAHRWLAGSYLSSEPLKSLELYRRAYNVDPVHPLINRVLTGVLMNFGRFDEAIAITADYHRMNPDDWQPFVWASRILAKQGREADSLKVYYRAFQLDQERMYYSWLLWHLIDYLGAPNELVAQWLEYWKDRVGDRYLSQDSDFGPEAAHYLVSGKPEKATRHIVSLQEQGRLPRMFGAYMALRMGFEFQQVREMYRRDFSQANIDPMHFDRGVPLQRWDFFTDFALLLKHTGEPRKAQELAAKLLDYAGFLLGEGLIFGPGDNSLYFHQAQLYVILGRHHEAVTALRQAAAAGYHVCSVCLRVFPHYDALRDEPGFEAVVVEIEARNAASIQRLEEEGMLLTPEEVLALKPIDFDPFAE